MNIPKEISNQKHGTLTEQEFVQIAALLIKAGYNVRKVKKKPPENPKTSAKWYVEYEE